MYQLNRIYIYRIKLTIFERNQFLKNFKFNKFTKLLEYSEVVETLERYLKFNEIKWHKTVI